MNDMDDLLQQFFGSAELIAGSGRTSPFTFDEVKRASQAIDSSGILAKLAHWRAEDRAGKNPGGRPASISDQHLLVAIMLLLKEHSPLLVSELRNVFQVRLDARTLAHLDLNQVQARGVSVHQEAKDWYNRIWRALHNLIDLMDGRPAPRRLMNKEERDYVVSLRDKNTMRLKRARANEFSNTMLEMTIQMLPRDVRRLWKGDISVDQTAVLAPSKRGRGGAFNNSYKDALVMELDAEWHSKKADHTGFEVGAAHRKNVWAYEANIAIMVAPKPWLNAEFPQLASAFTLSAPNKDLGGETVTLMKSLVDRGHNPGRITTDKAYFANIVPEDLAFPTRNLGFKPVTDYIDGKGSGKTGVIQGGQHGALMVEGQYLCPSTPKRLMEANKTYLELTAPTKEDLNLRDRQLAERDKYKLRQKEAPNQHGDRKMMCPAFGPGATATCPLRAAHPKSSNKDKAHVFNPPGPGTADHICTQTSVTFEPQEFERYEQHLTFGSKEWRETYSYDRQAIEGFNAYVKDPNKEALEYPGRRRMRGFAAQQFIVTMLLVSANMRRIMTFIRDLGRAPKPKRKPRERAHNSLKNYKPWLAIPVEAAVDPPLRT